MRRLLFTSLAAVLLAGSGLTLGGCVVAPARGYHHARVWVPGHWARPHVWVAGHYR